MGTRHSLYRSHPDTQTRLRAHRDDAHVLRRAQCFAEICWARANKEVHRSLDLGLLDGTEADRRAVVAACTAGRVRMPPSMPESVFAQLEHSSYCNPKDDIHLVKELYQESFEQHFLRVRKLDYARCGWGDEEAEVLAKLMSSGCLHGLEVLYLDNNHIGAQGMAALTTALNSGASPNIRQLVIERNAVSGNAVLRAVRKVCEKRYSRLHARRGSLNGLFASATVISGAQEQEQQPQRRMSVYPQPTQDQDQDQEAKPQRRMSMYPQDQEERMQRISKESMQSSPDQEQRVNRRSKESVHSQASA